MARIPHNVIGRVRSSQRALGNLNPIRVQFDPVAFGSRAANSARSLGDELLRFAGELQQRRDVEEELRGKLRVSQFMLEQEDVLDELDKQKPDKGSIDADYEVQFREKANNIILSTKEGKARQQIFLTLNQLYAKNTMRAQDKELARNLVVFKETTEQAINTATNVVTRSPELLDEQTEIVSQVIEKELPWVGRAEVRANVKKALRELTKGAQKGRARRNADLVIQEMLTGIVHTPGDAALLYNESKGNPRAFNPLGYAGLYQFGAPRLSDIGIYKKGAKENYGNWSKTPKDYPGKWSGRFNIPGHPNVKTLNDFLSAPLAQQKVWAINKDWVQGQIRKNEFDRFIGRYVGGVLITQQGLENMIHLGGVNGTRLFLQGKQNRKDINGTRMSDYAAAGARAPQHFIENGTDAILTPADKEEILNFAFGVQGDLRAKQKQIEEQSSEALKLWQDDNYSEALVRVAKGEETRESLIRLLDAKNVRPEQYRTLESDRDSLATEGDENRELELLVPATAGLLSVDDLLKEDTLNAQQKVNVLNAIRKAEKSGGPIANAFVEEEANRLKSFVGALPGAFGKFDAGEKRREASAMQEFYERVRREKGAPDKVREIVDDIIERYNPQPFVGDAIPLPSWWVNAGPVGRLEDRITATDRSIGNLESTYRSAENKNNDKMSYLEYQRHVRSLMSYRRKLIELQRRQAQFGNARRGRPATGVTGVQ